ncbi:MAG: DUF1638 domain-containing protein [FCB group bacterium]|jgi:hypothetical protein|nr:DUF1638 domain-containing protein [FCB group bacterium]
MKYHVISCHVLWRELCYYASNSKNVFTFQFLEQGLHNTPEILRQRVQEAIDAVPDGYDAVLIGYGLCSNGLMGIEARNVPLVVMRAHDCITFLLGSRQRYREYFDSHPGTYWYSPGWIDSSLMPGIERHDAVRKQYIEQYGEENADYLMEMEQGWLKAYSNCAYVDLGFNDTERYKEYTKRCAEWLGWKYEALEGDPNMLVRFVEGQWDGDDFLVVQPGRRIVPTHDDLVLGTE